MAHVHSVDVLSRYWFVPNSDGVSAATIEVDCSWALVVGHEPVQRFRALAEGGPSSVFDQGSAKSAAAVTGSDRDLLDERAPKHEVSDPQQSGRSCRGRFPNSVMYAQSGAT